MPRPPTVHEANAEIFLEALYALAPFYTPEWRPERDPGAGKALTRVASSFLHEIAQRLNRVPQKSYTAFLNMMGEAPFVARPAQVPLTFHLSAGANWPVTIPAGTRVTGSGLVFETDEPLSAVPQKLVHAIQSLPASDRVIDFKEVLGNPGKGTPIAANDRSLYLGWRTGLSPDWIEELEIELEGEHTELLARDLPGVNWHYRGDKAWLPFEHGASRQGTVTLTKPAEPFADTEIHGIRARWIRISLDHPLTQVYLKAASLRLPLPVKPAGAMVEAVVDIAGSREIDPAKPFFPFGKRPGPFSGFYLANRAVFSRAGMPIVLNLRLAEPGRPSGEARLDWEYWNGTGWVSIPEVEDQTEALSRDGAVRFLCPRDIAPFTLRGQKNYWLRVRLLAGDYGRESIEIAERQLVSREAFHPPCLASIRCSGEPARVAVDAVVGLNGFDLQRLDSEMGEHPAQPFPPLPPSGLYLCLDRVPAQGPLHLLFVLKEGEPSWSRDLQWQYGSEDGGWNRLAVRDGTHGLVESGILLLTVPEDWAESVHFHRRGAWLRGLDPNPERLKPVALDSLALNTVQATQTEHIHGEIPEPEKGGSGLRYRLKWGPVVSAEVWVDELGDLQSDLQLEGEPDLTTRQDRDENGRLLAFWVKWRPSRFLKTRSSTDRIYVLNPLTGVLQFGDGTYGRRPPGGTGRIKVDYRFGGGYAGNLPSGRVTALQTTLPLVDRVTNYTPAGGGADSESPESVLTRGPVRFIHRDRAVTAADYEMLALEASQGVARVRCFFDEARKKLVAVLVPRGPEARPRPDVQLRRRVARFLRERAPAMLDGGIEVRGPSYAAISALAMIHPRDHVQAPAIEQVAQQRLAAFLHPLTGGRLGKGWDFGQIPVLRDIHSVLDPIEGLVRIEIRRLTLELQNETETVVRDLVAEPWTGGPMPPRVLVANGIHRFTLWEGSQQCR